MLNVRTREQVEAWIEVYWPDSEGLMLADGLDAAFLGVGSAAPNTLPVTIYSTELIYEILMERDGMSRAEAQEFYDFNILPAYLGEQTPMFVDMMP